MTLDEVAETFGISRTLAYQSVRSKQIPAHKLGKRWILIRSEVFKALGAEEPS